VRETNSVKIGSRLVHLLFALAVGLIPPSARADDVLEDDLLLLPNWSLEITPEDPILDRTWRRTANGSYSLVNSSISDLWNTAKSPLGWRTREWLLFTGVVGGATALVYLGDDPIRDRAIASPNFERFGNKVRFLSDGTAFLAVTGGFLLSGALFRDKELETASLLIESVTISYVWSAGFKRVVGRSRPNAGGPRDFNPFSGNLSMPSGETTHAFAMASVVAEQYPNWPVRVLSYGLASCVGAARIARDGHWTSDVLVGAAIGTFVGRSVSWFHRERKRRDAARARRGLGPEQQALQHSFQVTTRSLHWQVRF
jgi:membrane-associated phospholipid phosphatase